MKIIFPTFNTTKTVTETYLKSLGEFKNNNIQGVPVYFKSKNILDVEAPTQKLNSEGFKKLFFAVFERLTAMGHPVYYNLHYSGIKK